MVLKVSSDVGGRRYTVSVNAKKIQPYSFLFATLAILFVLNFVQAVTLVPAAGSIPAGQASILVAEVFPTRIYATVNDVPTTQSSVNFTVQGRLLNTSNLANEFAPGSVNVTATIASTNINFSRITTASGFDFNITLPVTESVNNVTAGYQVYITTNTTNPAHNKTFNLYRTNATNVSFAFVNSFPPFLTGVNFTVNVSYFNGTNAIANGKPEIRIFKLNGVQQAWLVTNLSAMTNAQGILQYNVTIPADASGQYALVVDRGAGFVVFGIRSAFVPSFRTETPTGVRRSDFAVNATVNLVGTLRYSNGTPYNLVGTDTAVAFVTLPNRSIINTNLVQTNSVTLPGQMNSTFSQTDLPGAYDVRVLIAIGSTQYETRGTFRVSAFRASLKAGAGFFSEYGNKRIILPNSTVEFSILAFNNSGDALIPGSIYGGLNVINCTQGNVTFAGFTNVLTGANVTNYSQLAAGQPLFGNVSYTPMLDVCSLRVNVPNAVGVYRLDVNVRAPPSMGSELVTASALVQVETITLNVQPIQASGGFDRGDYSFQLSPGENASFQLSAFNFSSGSQFSSNSIQNVTVLSIAPLTFITGASNAFNNFTENGTANCKPCGSKPNPALPFYVSYPNTQEARVAVTLPNTTGYFEVTIQANVSGQFVTGRTYFDMKLIDGFASPGSGSTFGQQDRPSFGFGQASCAQGNVSYSAVVRDVKTNQGALGVRINSNLIMAMEEGTGRNIASLLSVPRGNTTNSLGLMAFNLSISQALPSGFYFMMFNVTYQGRDDTIFGMLNCKDSSSRLVISQTPFGRFRPDVSLFLNYNQLFTINTTTGSFIPIVNGTLEIVGMRGYNEDVSGDVKLLPNASQGRQRVNLTQGVGAQITLFPSNFSLAQWPQGTLMFQINVTNGSNPGPLFMQGPSWIVGGGHDSYAGAIQILAYELFFNSTPFGGVPLGTNLSIIVNASTNVSTSGQNFTVAFKRYGGGTRTPAVIQNTSLMIDGWNDSTSFGWEQWNVTFAVPTTLQAGEIQVEFTANNSKGVQARAGFSTFLTGFSVQTLTQDDMFMEGVNCRAFDESDDNGSMQGCFNPFAAGPLFNYQNNTHLNLSVLNLTYGVASRSDFVCLKRAFNFTQGNMGPFGPAKIFDLGTNIVVIDNNTPGLYDTLVINTSNGTQQIISIHNFSSSQRRFNGNTTRPYRDYYLSNIFQCAHLGLVNGSETTLQGYTGQSGESSTGDNFVNDVFYLPYRIQRGGGPVVANITHVGYAIKSEDGRPAGTLPDSAHRTNFTQSDPNGVAMVRVNITQSNRYQAIWDVNVTTGNQVVTDRAKTRGDSTSYGGGQGTRIDVIAFRTCRQQLMLPSFNVGDENVTLMCIIRDKSYAPIVGANVTVNLVSGGYYGKTVTAARLYNVSGDIVPRLNSTSMGENWLFTHPAGWPCNDGVRIEGNVTNGTITQLFDMGYAYRNCQYAGPPGP